jgi:hypothetical protein
MEGPSCSSKVTVWDRLTLCEIFSIFSRNRFSLSSDVLAESCDIASLAVNCSGLTSIVLVKTGFSRVVVGDAVVCFIQQSSLTSSSAHLYSTMLRTDVRHMISNMNIIKYRLMQITCHRVGINMLPGLTRSIPHLCLFSTVAGIQECNTYGHFLKHLKQVIIHELNK